MSKFTPTRKSNSCPACGDVSGKCRTTDSETVLCMETIDRFSTPNGWKFLGTTSGSYFAGKLVPINDDAPQKTALERRVERDARSAKRAIERANLPSLTGRHELLSNKPRILTASQNADLLRRGLTQAEIDWCLSQSYLWAERNGYGIGAIDPVTDLIVGGQIARDDRSPKYMWLLPGQTHLLETGQNPLAVWKSPDFDPKKPADIRFCEGFLHSLISALKSWRSDTQVVYVGAAGANFQDRALARVLGALPDGPMTLYPDAGAVSNRAVMQSYQNLAKLICPTVESTRKLGVAWWGQLDKTHPDCDELDGTESVEILPFWRFGQKTRALVTTVVNQRYLEPIALQSAPGNLFVSSPTGTGKTEIVEDLISQFFTRYPDGIADLIGYRNGLLLQTVSRIASKGRVNTVHKFNMDLNSGGWNGANSLAYCLNSLDQRLDALHGAIDLGRKIFLVLDEVGFIVSHWLELMKSQPQTGLNFARLLRRIGEGHGFIAGLQANLRDTPIDLIAKLTGESFPLSIVRNDYQGRGWDVKMVSVVNDRGGPVSTHAGIGAAQAAFDSAASKFTFITTSSQKWLERLDTVFSDTSLKLLRVDSHTVAAARLAQPPTPEQALIRELFKNPKRAIERARSMGYNAIGITPTAETGVSIDGTHFDQIIEYAASGTSEAVLQRLARDRNNSTPRLVFTTDRAADYRADIGTDADQILHRWNLNLKQGFNAARVFESLDSEHQAMHGAEPDELIKILSRYAAKAIAAQNGDRRELRCNIEARLLADGHEIARSEMAIDDAFKKIWTASLKTIECKKIEIYSTAPVISIDTAREILRREGTREEIYSAQKTVTLENYPGLDLNDLQLVERLIFERRGAALSAITQAWMVKNPAVAQAIDRACWKGHLSRGIVWAPSVKRESLKSQTLRDIGILEILALDEYAETTPEIVAFRSKCIQNNVQLRRICGYAAAFDESHSGIEMVGWILRRLNYKQGVTRKFGARGEQVRFWRAIDLNEGDRTLVEAALHQKWDSLEPAHSNNSRIGSHDFSVINHTRKIVTTDLNSPPIEVENAGINEVIYEFEYVPSADEIAEWGIAS